MAISTPNKLERSPKKLIKLFQLLSKKKIDDIQKEFKPEENIPIDYANRLVKKLDSKNGYLNI